MIDQPPLRDDVVAMLATYRERAIDDIPERIDSLELAWLVHQIEQRYHIVLDLSDDALHRMATVSGAVDVLGEILADQQAAARREQTAEGADGANGAGG